MNTVYGQNAGEDKGWKRYCYKWVNDLTGHVEWGEVWASDHKYAREKMRRLKVSGVRVQAVSEKVYDAR
jgi:hypothetical protein